MKVKKKAGRKEARFIDDEFFMLLLNNPQPIIKNEKKRTLASPRTGWYFPADVPLKICGTEHLPRKRSQWERRNLVESFAPISPKSKYAEKAFRIKRDKETFKKILIVMLEYGNLRYFANTDYYRTSIWPIYFIHLFAKRTRLIEKLSPNFEPPEGVSPRAKITLSTGLEELYIKSQEPKSFEQFIKSIEQEKQEFCINRDNYDSYDEKIAFSLPEALLEFLIHNEIEFEKKFDIVMKKTISLFPTEQECWNFLPLIGEFEQLSVAPDSSPRINSFKSNYYKFRLIVEYYAGLEKIRRESKIINEINEEGKHKIELNGELFIVDTATADKIRNFCTLSNKQMEVND